VIGAERVDGDEQKVTAAQIQRAARGDALSEVEARSRIGAGGLVVPGWRRSDQRGQLHDAPGERLEPFEQLVVDFEADYQGGVMERLGERRGELQNMSPDGKGRVRLDYLIPARGLIGFQSEYRTVTAGTGLLFHVFDHYGACREGAINARNNGVLISNGTGKSLAYALFNLQERGRMIIEAGSEVYEGQVVGIHNRGNDLTVNPMKGKQLTNIRTVLKDENVQLAGSLDMTLEQALEFIEDDELVEVTPENIRIRKMHLLEHERKRAGSWSYG
jgi:GTP-binding protein